MTAPEMPTIEDRLRLLARKGYGPSDFIGTCEAAADEIGLLKRGLQPWQPIETAPKDGTFIDVWVGGEFPKRITDVSWRKPTDSEWWVHGGDELKHPRASWFDAFGPLGKSSPPSHWMRAPSQPGVATKADAQ